MGKGETTTTKNDKKIKMKIPIIKLAKFHYNSGQVFLSDAGDNYAHFIVGENNHSVIVKKVPIKEEGNTIKISCDCTASSLYPDILCSDKLAVWHYIWMKDGVLKK